MYLFIYLFIYLHIYIYVHRERETKAKHQAKRASNNIKLKITLAGMIHANARFSRYN